MPDVKTASRAYTEPVANTFQSDRIVPHLSSCAVPSPRNREVMQRPADQTAWSNKSAGLPLGFGAPVARDIRISPQLREITTSSSIRM